MREDEARSPRESYTEMTELVLDAWQMCVPKKVAAAYFAAGPGTAGPDNDGPGTGGPG